MHSGKAWWIYRYHNSCKKLNRNVLSDVQVLVAAYSQTNLLNVKPYINVLYTYRINSENSWYLIQSNFSNQLKIIARTYENCDEFWDDLSNRN